LIRPVSLRVGKPGEPVVSFPKLSNDNEGSVSAIAVKM
jgi:hypothetical protein